MKPVYVWSLIVFASVILTASVLLNFARSPSFSALKSAYKSADRVILDRNGLLIDEIHRERVPHRFNWVKYEELPPYLRRAMLAARGISARRVSEWQGRKQTRFENFLRRKYVEYFWRDSELAEVDLNLSVFNLELQGIAAASFGLFDKAPGDLAKGEAAILLALENPDRRGLTERACDWLMRMNAPEECGLLSQDHLMQLERSYRIRPFVNLAPHFTQILKANPEIALGTNVRSTLDRAMQEWTIGGLRARGLYDSAVVALDNATGQVLIYVNNVASVADGIVHPAGSMLQPFLYAQALDERVLTVATSLENSSLPITLKSYRPARRDKVRVREAIRAKLTLPALQALEMLGHENFTKTLGALGFHGLEGGPGFGPSLALGTVNVKLLELTNAYRTLANGGVWSPVRVSPDKLTEKAPARVFSNEAAFIVSDVLADHNGRALATDAQGNWSVGFSDKYTVGIWSREPVAERLALETLNHLQGKSAITPPRAPETLIGRAVVTPEGEHRREWFLAGTEPREDDGALPKSRITFPQNSSTLALTPRPAREKILIQVAAPGSDQNLYLNGRRLGRARPYLPWSAESGKYILELRDSQGQVLDKVRFEAHGRGFSQAL